MRANVEPLIELIRGTVGNSKLWIYLPGDKDGDWFGHMVQYLIVPTAAAVEDSKHFLQAEDVASIAATWRPFDYVWIPELPSVEAGIGLARFSAGVGAPGLYRVRSSPGGDVTLEPLGEDIQPN